MKEKVQKVIDEIRPALEADGGNIELVEVGEDGVVKVRLMGACGSCPMSQLTLKRGVEARLKAKGTLSPQEYELMALKMGWTTKSEPGLPPPPSIEELEKRVKAAETPKP